MGLCPFAGIQRQRLWERKLQFMQKAKVRENVKEYALLTLGTVIMTLGIYFFKFPNHFSTGGVSGMAVIMSQYNPNFTNGDFVKMINILLLNVSNNLHR